MFCPLCKSEYRTGFTECSDCHSKLVATESEANYQTATTLWKGFEKSRFEDLLSALQYANIPHRFAEHLKYRHQSHSDYEYEVRILLSDNERAQKILGQMEEQEKVNDVDFGNDGGG
jgi:hypothetical protein